MAIFGRFTERAQRALASAPRAAAELHQPYVGTEHILLGLLREGDMPPAIADRVTEEDVREVARQYKEHDLPLDMICMDIDYMQDYADFTVNKERFPDLAKLSADLKAQGIRLVPIIDAGVRIDSNDPTCTEGLEKGYFCKKADGTPFVAAVWPG